MAPANAAVAPGDTVLLRYRLSTPAGETITDNFGDGPETFVIGAVELAEHLERCIVGLAEGAHRTFHLSPGEAFGETDSALVRELAREDFPKGFDLVAGSLVEFELPDGRSAAGLIQTWTDTTVTVDFNHPLSGCPVVFEVEVVEICR